MKAKTFVLEQTDENTYAANLPNNWRVCVFRDCGDWLVGVSHIKDYQIEAGKVYTRKDHAVRGLNRLLVTLGWPYAVK